MDQATRQKMVEYLSSNHILTLATCGPDQLPWATSVFYANADFDIYFLSSPSSRHATNIAFNHKVAASVFTNCYSWKQIKGLQLFGEAYQVEGEQKLRGWKTYLKRLSFTKELLVDLSGVFRIGEKLVNAKLYRIEVLKAIYTDNVAGFAHKEELTFKKNLKAPEVRMNERTAKTVEDLLVWQKVHLFVVAEGMCAG